MLKLTKKIFIVSFILLAVFITFNFAMAATLNPGTNFIANSGLGNEDIRQIIANIVRVLLGFLGIIAVVLIIYAVAGGALADDADKAGRAKNILIAAVIGLIIILAAFALTTFILNNLIQATT